MLGQIHPPVMWFDFDSFGGFCCLVGSCNIFFNYIFVVDLKSLFCFLVGSLDNVSLIVIL